MSVYSMTGYASLQTPAFDATGSLTGTVQHSDPATPAPTRLGLELRSVNSRFLDLSFKLTDELRSCENQLRDLLTQQLKRGKIELRAYVLSSAQVQSLPGIPPVQVLQALEQIQSQVLAVLPQARELSVADVLKLSSQGTVATPTDHSAALIALTQQALNALLATREREGARLASMLGAHCAQLRTLVSTAQPLVPKLVAAQQQRFLERFSQALHQADGNPPSVITATAAQERALTEAAAFAMRIDVAEELTRLTAHLDEIEALLQGNTHISGQAKTAPELGKRLDFIIQELHREANTLGSKSSTLELSRISVAMKVLIEQMREQVQNIE